MKIISLLVLCIALINAGYSQTLKTPAPSPGQTIKQDFSLSSVEVSYSRPGIKGRTVFGDLVPFGKVWRTGANGATTVTFGEDVIIGGKKIAAGKYGLLSIPGQQEWTIIITKQTNVTNAAAYKESEDVVRFKAKAEEMSFPLETMMIAFNNIKSSSMDMMIIWDKTAVTFPVKTESDGKVMLEINNMMNKENFPYFDAALYYLENGKDLNKAVSWFDKAIEKNPQGFWIYYQKASALAKLGKKQEAIVSAKKSIEFAKVASNDDYVALNEKLIASLN